MDDNHYNTIIDQSGRTTLKDQVRNYLFNQIKRNVFQVNEKLPTERELARQLNVSKRTVENAMRELARQGVIYRRVGRGTFVKAFDPDHADMLSRPDTVMVAVSNLINPVFSAFVAKVERCLFDSGKRITTASTHLLTSQQKKFIRMIEQGDLDGIIVLSATEEFYEAASRMKIPMVRITSNLKDGPGQILNDEELAGRLAVEYLVELGHRHIVCAGCIPVADVADLPVRFRVALEVMKQHGLPTEHAIVTQLRKPGMQPDYEGMGRELIDNILQLPQVPTGIIFYNDARAFGAINALREKGIEVPRDISVIGCDNVQMCGLFHPTLTSIDLKLEYAAQKAVEILMSGRIKQRIILKPELVKRNSCRSIK